MPLTSIDYLNNSESIGGKLLMEKAVREASLDYIKTMIQGLGFPRVSIEETATNVFIVHLNASIFKRIVNFFFFDRKTHAMVCFLFETLMKRTTNIISAISITIEY